MVGGLRLGRAILPLADEEQVAASSEPNWEQADRQRSSHHRAAVTMRWAGNIVVKANTK